MNKTKKLINHSEPVARASLSVVCVFVVHTHECLFSENWNFAFSEQKQQPISRNIENLSLEYLHFPGRLLLPYLEVTQETERVFAPTRSQE